MPSAIKPEQPGCTVTTQYSPLLTAIKHLPEEIIIVIFKHASYKARWALLQNNTLSQTTIDVLKSNELWQPLFETCFPNQTRLNRNERYFDAFKRIYTQWLVAIKKKGSRLRLVSPYFKNDPDFVYAAIKQNGQALRYASQHLQKSPAIVLEAMKQNSLALWWGSDLLKKNAPFILAAIKYNRDALWWARPELKNDRRFILKAVSRNGLALELIHPHQKDPEITLTAIKQNRQAFKYAAESFQKQTKLQEIARICKYEKRARACDCYLRQLITNTNRQKKHPFTEHMLFKSLSLESSSPFEGYQNTR